ncbi:LuxR family transcriptional regulator [Microbacterium bovistercoris]|uniref:LuxR family transcriptional regulator n=1 Tax=Microbacterium bovistercoris TaxID=2293570 RepID=A0A371NXH4_9MICO|nr:LuxR family transcriptional regulator [Microbacterium bovistercoris]REJ07795.1 LuxR family transcriptional regulator [Microbacterium bovistercoris]
MFLGREAELRALTTALDDTAASGRVIVVLGEGGIGKSTLIEQALSRAGSGRVVLRAGADAMEQRRSLGLLLDAYGALLTDDDRRIIDERNAHAVTERLLAVTDSVATAPTALVLEDLQWADDASLALLTRVSRTLAQLPLLIVCSLRTQARHETSPALDHLLSVLSERGLLSQIEVPRLPDATCVTIVERLTGGRVEGALAHYVEAAGGNPLFLTEMVRSLLRDHAVTIAPDGQAQLVAAPVGPSPSLSMVMMRHLSHLGAATREMLTTAALLGTRFSVTQLRVVAGQPMSALVPMLREAFAAGFLEEIDDDALGFRHELIQEVLLQDVPAAVRAELHREVALRMDAAGVAPATVAGHLLQAPVSREDLDWMLQLAQRTAIAAPLLAAELWERVAHHTDAGDERHVRATAGLARAALSSGRAADASILAEQALGEDVPADVLPALTLTYTHALMQQHRQDESQEQSQQWALSELIEPADRAAHLAFAGWPRLMLGDLDGAKRLAAEGAALAATVGNHGAQVTALALHGQIADFQGDLDMAVSLLSTAVETADQHPSLASIEAFPHALLALALADAGRTDGVAALLQRGLRVSEEFGYRTGMVAAHAFGAQALSSTSILSDITAELDAHHSLVGTMDVRMIGPVLGLRACMVARQQGPAAAVEFADLLDPVPDRSTWAGRGRAWIWRGLSQRDRARDDHAAALEVLWTGWQDCLEADMLMECAELGLDLVLLSRLVAGIRPAESRLVLERAHTASELLAAFADRNPDVTYLRAIALAVRGVLDEPEAVLEAERLMATTPRRLDHARLAEVAARALPARSGERRMLAETALREYAEIGADHEVTRARAGFRKTGIPVLSPPRTRPTFGWDSLTRTEEKVAAQLATGATNPQIAQRLNVSRRTVETHVSNILAKLGLRTRTEVAVFVARRLDDVGEHRE